MKRDMEIIRKMVLLLAKDGVSNITSFSDLDRKSFDHYAFLLIDGGLATGDWGTRIGNHSGRNKGMDPKDYEIFSLTWKGHEFADSIADDSIWTAARKSLGSVGAFTVNILQDVLSEQIKRGLDNPLV